MMSVVHLFGAMLALVLVLVIVPARVFPRMPSAVPLEQLAADLVWAVAAVAAASVVLVPLHLYQALCFVLLAIGGMWFRWHRRGGTLRNSIDRWATRCRAALYLVEAASRHGNDEVKQAVRTWFRGSVLARLRPTAPGADRAMRWALVLPMFLIVGGTTVAHLVHPLRHSGLFPASAYGTLARMGELSFGRLFGETADPPGLTALLATAAKLGPASDHDMVRFAAPLLLVPALMTVYAIALRASANPGMALATVAVAALGTLRADALPGIELPGTVPSALAVTVALACVLVAMGYGTAPSRSRAWTLAAGALAVALTDPSHLALPLVASVAAGVAAAGRARRAWVAVRPAMLTAAATAIGLLPYVVVAAVRDTATGIHLPTPVGPDGADILPLLSAVAAVVVLGRRLGKSTASSGALVALAITVLAACAYEEAAILLPLGPLLAVEAVRGRRSRGTVGVARLGGSVAIGVVLCVALVVLVQPTAPTPAAASEHESAARELNELLARETTLTYTVVGPPTWTDRVVGSAYRADLTEFARRLTLEDAIDPGFALPVPSKRALVLVEKRAFETSYGGHPYDDPEDRAALMAAVSDWLDRYARFHDGAATVYEDEQIRIWSIDQARDAALSERFGMARR